MNELAEQWPAIVGTVLPAAIAVITRQYWSRGAKALTSLAVVWLVTSIGLVVEGQIVDAPRTLADFANVFAVTLAATFVAYRTLWDPTGAAEAIETRVNQGANPDPGPDGEPPLVIPERAEGGPVAEEEGVYDLDTPLGFMANPSQPAPLECNMGPGDD